ncbi:MAG: histidine kinase [Taibaiella sp.]|nr:histidine kinase [Taibaiella sp.]
MPSSLKHFVQQGVNTRLNTYSSALLIFRFTIVLLFICLWGKPGTAQDALMTHYTQKDGLPSNVIYDIYQDTKGYIWLATNKGISQFDGRTFHNYSIKDGLPDNDILNLAEDTYNRLWLVSYNEQPSYIKDGKIYSAQNDALCSMLVKKGIKYTSLIKWQGNDYFSGNQLARIGKDTIIPFASGINLKRPGPVIPYKGQQYFIADKSFYLYKNGQFKPLLHYDFHYATFFKGKLYLTGYEKLYHSRISCFSIHDTSLTLQAKWQYRDRLYGLTVYDGQLMCLTERGIFNFDTATGNLSPSVFRKAIPFTKLLKDKEGNTWLISIAYGVYLYRNLTFSTYTKASGLKHNEVASLSLQSGMLFAGYHDGSFDCIQGNKISNISIFDPDKYNTIKFVYKKGTASYIIGSHQGVFLYSNGARHLIDQLSYKGSWLADNECLFGTTVGAVRYDIAHNQMQKIFNSRVTAIAKDRGGRIWLGTLQGLRYIDKERVFDFKRDSTLSKSRITGLFVSNDQTLLIATHKEGLFLLKDDRLSRITTAEGLSSNTCEKVIADHTNTVWLCTDNGLDRISIQNILMPKIYTYSTANGLPPTKINDIAVDSGRIFLATDEGITIMPYSYMPDHNFRPDHVYIHTVTVGDSVYYAPQTLRLPYNRNDLQVAYTAIAFGSGGNVQYKYLLEGSTSDTMYTSLEAIRLSGLSPGKYRLSVWARLGQSGSWGKSPAVISIYIAAPWWGQAWFLIALIIISVLILYFAYRRKVNYIRRRAREKNKQIQDMATLEMQALRAQINPHFIFNALNSIQYYYTRSDELTANNYMNIFAQLIRRTLEYSKAHWLSLKEEIETLELYIKLEQMRFKNAFRYELSVESQIDLHHTLIPAMLLQPYVENAINHGFREDLLREDPVLKLQFCLESNVLLCRIEDNGIGMKQSAMYRKPGHRSLGLSINRQRIDTINLMYHTDIKLKIEDRGENNPGTSGTLILLHIPKKINNNEH